MYTGDNGILCMEKIKQLLANMQFKVQKLTKWALGEKKITLFSYALGNQDLSKNK